MARIIEGQNSAKPEEIASYVDEIEQLNREHLEFKVTKMAEISAHLARTTAGINEQLDDAKSKGAKKATIKAVVKARAAKVKAEKTIEEAKAVIEELETDEKTIAVSIFTALGDDFASFGLGAAAVQSSGEQQPDDERDPIAAAADKAWNEADPGKKKAGRKPKADAGAGAAAL